MMLSKDKVRMCMCEYKFVNVLAITMGNKACFHTPTSMTFYEFQAHIGNHLPYFQGQIT